MDSRPPHVGNEEAQQATLTGTEHSDNVEKHTMQTSHQERHTVSDELAHLANAEDHKDTKWQAIRRNPWAFAWCLFAVWTVLLVSFENQASGNILGIPEFRKDFGFYYDGNWVLSAKWQSAFSGAPIASQIVGNLGSGQVADLIGRRNTLIIALVITFAAITMEFVATTNELFFGGKFLNGFAVGTIQTVATTYVGEIVPLALRGLMTCLIALSFTVGPFTVALIVNSTGTYDNRWAYRAVFCSQYGFAVISSLFIWRMPESPWFLVDKRKNESKALRSLQRLGYSSSSGEDVKRLANIKLTLEQVRRETDGATYLECFRRSNLRRTIISITPLSVQQFTGIVFAASYSTYYAQLAGYSTAMSFKLQIIQQVLSMFGNVISWYLIDRVGRRFLTLYGTIGLTAVLWVMGGLAVGGSQGELKGTVAMILVYCWLYNVTIGATAFTVLTEVSTSRLRAKTIAIGLAVQGCLNILWSFVLPYLFNPDKADLGGKLGFIFGGLCFPCIAFLWWYQPETRGRSYEELDEMFMKSIAPRKFASYTTEAEMKGQEVQQRVYPGKETA
ncbi:Alpha-glucosides permease MPH3 [Cyphellophora attinorum]|uniref:Alpha-glucosides permease MPH3 n=1 Tax=Cyphellophora attinorum TaxID=1664694 RepID=A0A0N1P3Q9_9EURO|nr:Alpha-glucosides permease MPH3 [Phialophora attinorum]KPI45636.1 Alpha-glucosides permease MPH3 [Phialophora attinorum]